MIEYRITRQPVIPVILHEQYERFTIELHIIHDSFIFLYDGIYITVHTVHNPAQNKPEADAVTGSSCCGGSFRLTHHPERRTVNGSTI